CPGRTACAAAWSLPVPRLALPLRPAAVPLQAPLRRRPLLPPSLLRSPVCGIYGSTPLPVPGVRRPGSRVARGSQPPTGQVPGAGGQRPGRRAAATRSHAARRPDTLRPSSLAAAEAGRQAAALQEHTSSSSSDGIFGMIRRSHPTQRSDHHYYCKRAKDRARYANMTQKQRQAIRDRQNARNMNPDQKQKKRDCDKILPGLGTTDGEERRCRLVMALLAPPKAGEEFQRVPVDDACSLQKFILCLQLLHILLLLHQHGEEEEGCHVDEKGCTVVVEGQRYHGEDTFLVEAHVDELRCCLVGCESDAEFLKITKRIRGGVGGSALSGGLPLSSSIAGYSSYNVGPQEAKEMWWLAAIIQDKNALLLELLIAALQVGFPWSKELIQERRLEPHA
ncbi:hypothetical protein U9M48_040442, partial [Paspalum notatum var. saurae]